MRNRGNIAMALIAATVFGGLFGTLPMWTAGEMPETGLKDEPCTLDEVIADHESVIEKNKESLDALLESARIDAQSMEIVMEPRTWPTEPTEAPTTAETETAEEILEETETAETAPYTQAIYEPVNSMMPADLQAWVYAYASEQGVDPYIIMAICERESCCTANIYGDNGKAYGMMQIHVRWVQDKLAARGYTNEDMLKAQPNIEIGIEILRDYLNTGNGYEWALMAYNGGPQAAGTQATQEYARWVLNRAEELRR